MTRMWGLQHLKFFIWLAVAALISSQVVAVSKVFGYGDFASAFVYFWIGVGVEKWYGRDK